MEMGSDAALEEAHYAGKVLSTIKTLFIYCEMEIIMQEHLLQCVLMS